mgnify:CR=1 FL=1
MHTVIADAAHSRFVQRIRRRHARSANDCQTEYEASDRADPSEMHTTPATYAPVRLTFNCPTGPGSFG